MTGNAWTTQELLERLERRDGLFVLDVRNREEFERFRLEGCEPLATVNVPYFEMLELGGKDEMLDSVMAYVERDLAGQLPTDRPALAVCAKGETSEFVAEGLRRLGYASASLEGGMRAWGKYYATRAVEESSDAAVYQISRPARGCLSYAIASEGKAIVIDPGRHLGPYLALAREKGFAIETVIDTHGHADHISGGPGLAAKTGARYHLHPYDAIHPMDLAPAAIPYEFIREGQVFRVGRSELEALHVPGHTLGMTAFRLRDRYLFSGDSIFIRSIARPDLGGKAEAWAPLHARSLKGSSGCRTEFACCQDTSAASTRRTRTVISVPRWRISKRKTRDWPRSSARARMGLCAICLRACRRPFRSMRTSSE